MKIGLIDNELCTRKGHHFPNLALMKLSSYYKNKGYNVDFLNIEYLNNSLFLHQYDKIYLSKVFSDTYTPNYVFKNNNLIIGGSGFYYELAEKLPYEIEHSKPDYDLYSQKVIEKYVAKNRTKYFTDFSIGFTTRGCIRRCSFCINKNERTVYKHSDLNEFIDSNKKYIMLLDDNIVAYEKFEEVFNQLNATGKPFVYKQGMDFRLLDERKMDIIFNSNYYSNSESQSKGARTFHFAFDNINDYDIIKSKLEIYYNSKQYSFKVMFYVLVGYDRSNKYDNNFYFNDIIGMLKRVELLYNYNAYSYIMKHLNYRMSPFSSIIEDLAQLLSNPFKVTNKTIEEAIIESGYDDTLKWIKQNASWFLQLRFNSKLKKYL